MGKMTTKANLGAIYRLEFYKNKKDWNLTRTSKSEANIGTNTNSGELSRTKHASRPDLNARYEINSMYLSDGDETTTEPMHSITADSGSTCVQDDFLSGSIRGSTSLQSLDSERGFMRRASLVPHSSEVDLRQPPPQDPPTRESVDRNAMKLRQFPRASQGDTAISANVELQTVAGLSRRQMQGSPPRGTPATPPVQRYPKGVRTHKQNGAKSQTYVETTERMMQYHNENPTHRPSSNEYAARSNFQQDAIYHDPPLQTTVHEYPTQTAFACQRQMSYQESSLQSRVVCEQKVLYRGPPPFQRSISNPTQEYSTHVTREQVMMFQEPPPFTPSRNTFRCEDNVMYEEPSPFIPHGNTFRCEENVMYEEPPTFTPPNRNNFRCEDNVMYDEPPSFTPPNRNAFRCEDNAMYEESPPFTPPNRNNFRCEENVMYDEPPSFSPPNRNNFRCEDNVMYEKTPPFTLPNRNIFRCEENVMYDEPPSFTPPNRNTFRCEQKVIYHEQTLTGGPPMQDYPQWGDGEEPPLLYYDNTLSYPTPPLVAPAMARNERVAIVQGRPRRVVDY